MQSNTRKYRLVSPSGKWYDLAPGQTHIGRGPGNQVALPLSLVSRQHAAIHFDGQNCYVIDLGSTHGTLLNGQRLQPRRAHRLRPGDVLSLAGQATLFLREVGRPLRRPGEPAPRRRRSPLIPILAIIALLLVLALMVLAILLVWPEGGLSSLALLGSPTPAHTATPLPATAKPTTPPTTTHTPTLTPHPTTTSTQTASPTPVTPTATPIPLPDASVAIDRLNLRAGPSTDYDIVGKLRQGDALEVMGKAYGCRWLRVVTPQGKQGWVSGLTQYVVLNLVCADIPAAPIPPRPTRLPTATPTPDNRPKIQIVIQNDTNGQLRLVLDGPTHYELSFQPGRHEIYVVAGSYQYKAWGCGGATKSGTQTLNNSSGDWRWWCSSF
jgi:hypothetical protein